MNDSFRAKASRILAWIFVFSILSSNAGARPVPEALFPPEEQPRNRWAEEADRTFNLPQGMARRLMTQAEWQEYRSKMQYLKPKEREQYKREFPNKLSKMAKERGFDITRRTPGSPGSAYTRQGQDSRKDDRGESHGRGSSDYRR